MGGSVKILHEVAKKTIIVTRLTGGVVKEQKPTVYIEGTRPWTSISHSFAITLTSQEK